MVTPRPCRLHKGVTMSKPLGLASLLLVSSALVAPCVAMAQSTAGDVATGTVPTAPEATGEGAVAEAPPSGTPVGDAPTQPEQAGEEAPDISLPGVSND